MLCLMGLELLEIGTKLLSVTGNDLENSACLHLGILMHYINMLNLGRTTVRWLHHSVLLMELYVQLMLTNVMCLPHIIVQCFRKITSYSMLCHSLLTKKLVAIELAPVDVLTTLHRMPPKVSMGPDLIPSCILKCCAVSLALPLCIVQRLKSRLACFLSKSSAVGPS